MTSVAYSSVDVCRGHDHTNTRSCIEPRQVGDVLLQVCQGRCEVSSRETHAPSSWAFVVTVLLLHVSGHHHGVPNVLKEKVHVGGCSSRRTVTGRDVIHKVCRVFVNRQASNLHVRTPYACEQYLGHEGLQVSRELGVLERFFRLGVGESNCEEEVIVCMLGCGLSFSPDVGAATVASVGAVALGTITPSTSSYADMGRYCVPNVDVDAMRNIIKCAMCRG